MAIGVPDAAMRATSLAAPGMSFGSTPAAIEQGGARDADLARIDRGAGGRGQDSIRVDPAPPEEANAEAEVSSHP